MITRARGRISRAVALLLTAVLVVIASTGVARATATTSEPRVASEARTKLVATAAHENHREGQAPSGINYDEPSNLARTKARPGVGLLAPRMADDFVDLASPARRTHILQGDATGGGHLWPGAAGKAPFPQSWSGNRVMHEISDIATDPIAWRGAIPQGSRTVLTGTRGGVDIRVIVDSRSGEIISGYPTNLLRNP